MLARRWRPGEIRTSQEAVACDVCGRTLLRGEHTETWLAGGSRREVCELCTARARHEGWVREGARLEVPAADARGERRRSLFGRLRERGERLARARAGEGDGDGAEESGRAAGRPRPRARAPRRRRRPRRPWPKASRATSTPCPPSAEQRSRRGARDLQRLRLPAHRGRGRALARRAGRTVRPVAGGSRACAVVVSWELSWYRYEVDLGNPGAGVEQPGRATSSTSSTRTGFPTAVADEYGACIRLGASVHGLASSKPR